MYQHHSGIKIDKESLENYARQIVLPKFIPDWKDYLHPESCNLDISEAFFDLAVNASQNAGYYYERDGVMQKWEKEGSGAAALVELHQEFYAQGIMPRLTFYADLQALEKEVFVRDLPFAEIRTKIYQEFANVCKAKSLETEFNTQCKAKDKDAYHFSFESIVRIAQIFSNGFGEDPFLKKAFLLPILFAGYAHAKGIEVTMDTCAPADYRLPQTLNNIGILRLSDDLIDRIEAKTLTPEDVDAIRAATVVAVNVIRELRPDLQMHHIDGELWFAGRKNNSLDQFWNTIGAQSNFKQDGFTNRTYEPMQFKTMRF